jgi:uncharacterized iron-regulated membrane protein
MRGALYRIIWRWHLYAGLFVMPFIAVLALSGAVYLFKPQIDRWEERAFQNQPTGNAVTPSAQVAAAIAGHPGATLSSYRLPQVAGDAALVHLKLPNGSMRDVFIAPQGSVLGSLDPEGRIIAITRKIHGQLLLGERGSWLVELAASWAIVMILTGLYLWWPRGADGLAGVAWPRLRRGRQTFWRDLHAVTGFWVAGLALVLLVSGLPWTSVWGDAFKAVRGAVAQDWTTGGSKGGDEHAEHDHMAMTRDAAAAPSLDMIDTIVTKAQREALAFPVLIEPPSAATRVWTVKSDAQNRPLRVTLTYDAVTGTEQSRKTFVDRPVVDHVIGYGVAWHEGQLFGWINQAIGVFTALSLLTLMVSGFVLWRRRKPDGRLGAPPVPAVPARIGGVVVIMLLLAAVLPLLALSLVVLFLFDRLALPRLPKLATWLGLQTAIHSRR